MSDTVKAFQHSEGGECYSLDISGRHGRILSHFRSNTTVVTLRDHGPGGELIGQCLNVTAKEKLPEEWRTCTSLQTVAVGQKWRI